MRIASVIDGTTPRAARVEGGDAVLLDAPDVLTLLADVEWHRRAAAGGPLRPLHELELAPVVRPARTICVGLNYRSHILEMGRPLPEHPTLFAKFPDTLIGAHDDIVLPAVATSPDWEAELGVVIGRAARRVTPEQAPDHIAGFTVVNDITMRDWQWRTTEWLQGKAFEATTPVGPVVVTPDEVDGGTDLTIRCEVDGDLVQEASTRDLLFDAPALVSYISQFLTLRPGDLVATGTPGGVGAGRDPQVFLRPGQRVRTTIEGIGACDNLCVSESA